LVLYRKFLSTLLLQLMALLAAGRMTPVARGDDWPHWFGPQRDGVWREKGILRTFPSDGLKVRWRTPIGGGYDGPAVAGGRVYLVDRLVPGELPQKSRPGGGTGKERVLCLEEASGEVVWKHEYDCHYDVGYPAGPRATPIVHDGKVYTLGTMGRLLCLQAATGELLWEKDFPADYHARVPTWGFSANPLLDGDRLICMVGGQGSVTVAFHKDTGNDLWRALSAPEPGYCPPVIFEVGGVRQLIIWHPEAVNSLNPVTGEVYWSQPFYVRAGITLATPRLAGNLLFVSCFYNGPLMLKLAADRPQAEVLWKGGSNSEQPRLTRSLHSLMCTPFIKAGYLYGVCTYGQLRCVNAETGERVWETLQATGTQEEPVERWANAFIVAHEDRFFLFNEKGDLIIARLTPQGYDEISRTHVIEPTNRMPGRPVVWSHPAFANRSIYIRNDKEIVCLSLAE
jgi:outer membrane protein assembly factor BamB